jgi:hypothetical protein
MPRDNVFDRFRKNLARAAETAGTAPDAVVDAALFDARLSATPPSTSRTVPAGSRRSPAFRKDRAPA